LSLEQFIAKAARLGFDAVMLMAKRPHLSLLDMASTARAHVKKLADDNGIHIVVIAGYNDFAAGADVTDVPLREMQVYYIGELARLAADLGCALVRVFTSFERETVPYGINWNQTAACLREAARRAADFGVTLGIQNHHDLAVHVDSLADLLSEIAEPNCKACFDAWAVALQGGDLAQAVERMAPWLAHTTVADYVHRPRFQYLPSFVNYAPKPEVVRAVPMGQGFIDYPAFFRALVQANYSGYVAYEMCSPLQGGGSEANLDRCAAAFIAYMQELSGEQ
jgi:sugar phosphate isomerase/epimerase